MYNRLIHFGTQSPFKNTLRSTALYGEYQLIKPKMSSSSKIFDMDMIVW